MTVFVGVPIKPFGVAKARLSGVMDAAHRARIGKAIAAHTLSCIAVSGVDVVVVTGDADVAAWATHGGWRAIPELRGGLDGAAAAVVDAAADGPWAVVHADLPVMTPDDVTAVWDRIDHGRVIAPSRDGGTSVIAGRGRLDFRYGHLSFHSHLAAMSQDRPPVVVARPGLALDLDTPDDLRIAIGMPGGAWLNDLLPRHLRSTP